MMQPRCFEQLHLCPNRHSGWFPFPSTFESFRTTLRVWSCRSSAFSFLADTRLITRCNLEILDQIPLWLRKVFVRLVRNGWRWSIACFHRISLASQPSKRRGRSLCWIILTSSDNSFLMFVQICWFIVVTTPLGTANSTCTTWWWFPTVLRWVDNGRLAGLWVAPNNSSWTTIWACRLP